MVLQAFPAATAFLVLLSLSPKGLAEQCLNATSFGFTRKTSLRTSSFGEQDFVLTIASGLWDTSDLAANLVKILAEDLLGVQVNVLNHFTFSSDKSLQLVAGLEFPTEIDFRNASLREMPLAQISMDVWQTASWQTYSYLRDNGLLRRVTNMGDAGYSPQAAMYTFRPLVEHAWAEKRLALDFYRTYISDVDTVLGYFNTTAEILDVMSGLNISPGCLRLPGAQIGHETLGTANAEVYQCDADGFYYPPGCRVGGEAAGAILAGRCVPFLVGGYWPFDTVKVAQLVTRTGVPIAVTWVEIPEQIALVSSQPAHGTNFIFWWSDHFRWYQEISPVHLRFDKYDERAWLAGDVTTDVGQNPVIKYIWGDLMYVEEQVAILVQNYRILMEDMRAMMIKQSLCMGLDMSKAPACRWQAACEWLRETADQGIWTSWLPQETDCPAGYTWDDGTCAPCPAGMLKLLRGPQACQVCPNGTFSRVEGNRIGCTPCEAGTVSSQASGQPATECTLCPLDSYQDDPGQSDCQLCPPADFASSEKACQSCPQARVATGALMRPQSAECKEPKRSYCTEDGGRSSTALSQF